MSDVTPLETIIAHTLAATQLYMVVKHLDRTRLMMRMPIVGHRGVVRTLAGLPTTKEQAFFLIADHLLYRWSDFTWPQIEAPKA